MTLLLSKMILMKTNFSIVKNLIYKMHSNASMISGQNLSVKILPALDDNFMYLIIDEKTKDAAIVDPVNPKIACQAIDESKVNLKKILTTHHHWDHAGGNKSMHEKYKNVEILGGDDRIEAINQIVSHDDTFNIGSLNIKCLATPCHTSGHICYLVTDDAGSDPPAVFTGDTLFIGGCGRFFEGTPGQMFKALNEILGSLPDETRVYCGHEYTCKNLEFGLTIEPNNEEIKNTLKWATEKRNEKSPTVPSTIGKEKKINPFMRVNTPSILARTSAHDPIKAMEILRKEKDNF
ncbi:hypothetical protein PV328_006560 [Microctonus aethiopoides]|uniref:hydroxyacylglutathione hydrolase n=2 Tax=Microctonus aethiopoides TaxID=144406 RepID=A0AA39FPS8_9HYME|nr:hypothetical protein PV328_006560 [Microctonus aethiopoides]